MIFVDTSVWFARVVSSDPDHLEVRRWHDRVTEPLVTTDYVIDEALTLLTARGHRARALTLGRGLFGGQLAQIHYTTAQQVTDAWAVFQRFHDKDWSFTDCVSYVVMQSLGITTAASFDHHFKQFGTVTVVP